MQYVTVVTGFTGAASIFTSSSPNYVIDYRTMARRVLTFAVGGTATLPPNPPPAPRVAHTDPDFAPDQARDLKGLIAYSYNCLLCHGQGAVAGGAAPDLRWSAAPSSQPAFHAIVRDGALLSHGMPKFDDLSPDMVEDIRFYLRARARETQQASAAKSVALKGVQQ